MQLHSTSAPSRSRLGFAMRNTSNAVEPMKLSDDFLPNHLYGPRLANRAPRTSSPIRHSLVPPILQTHPHLKRPPTRRLRDHQPYPLPNLLTAPNATPPTPPPLPNQSHPHIPLIPPALPKDNLQIPCLTPHPPPRKSHRILRIPIQKRMLALRGAQGLNEQREMVVVGG